MTSYGPGSGSVLPATSPAIWSRPGKRRFVNVAPAAPRPRASSPGTHPATKPSSAIPAVARHLGLPPPGAVNGPHERPDRTRGLLSRAGWLRSATPNGVWRRRAGCVRRLLGSAPRRGEDQREENWDRLRGYSRTVTRNVGRDPAGRPASLRLACPSARRGRTRARLWVDSELSRLHVYRNLLLDWLVERLATSGAPRTLRSGRRR